MMRPSIWRQYMAQICRLPRTVTRQKRTVQCYVVIVVFVCLDSVRTTCSSCYSAMYLA